MAVPTPSPKEFPKPVDTPTADYYEGVEVTVPPIKVYTLQMSTNPLHEKKGWYICKEGRSGIAIGGVDFIGEDPINVEEAVDPTTSQAVVETQIRIDDVGNVGD